VIIATTSQTIAGMDMSGPMLAEPSPYCRAKNSWM
jgi:hypothetical protein